MDTAELWGKDMGMEGERGNGKVGRKILKVGTRGRSEDAKISGDGGIAKGAAKNEGREEGF